MVSQKSVDGLLIGALFKLYATRFERAQAFAARIGQWRRVFSTVCPMFVASSLMWRKTTQEDFIILVIAALCLPQVFGYFLGLRILTQNAVPSSEEIGHTAADISDVLPNMRLGYGEVFLALLRTIVDEETERSIFLAEELDCYGNQAAELTDLVRTAYG